MLIVSFESLCGMVFLSSVLSWVFGGLPYSSDVSISILYIALSWLYPIVAPPVLVVEACRARVGSGYAAMNGLKYI